ncbi:MAG: serine/threonine protein kinase [Kofleriaceae bacterium]
MQCPSCQKEVLDIDVRCTHCGTPLGATGAHRMLGTVVLGQYELVDVLGQGGMSVVFKGRHKMTDQEVALKILPPELAAHSQVKSRFLEEAKALAALDHPNIVHLYNFGQENGFFVLAMQFVQGRTWERIILENKRMEWTASVRVCIDVLRALEYAHGRGVIHRDMKPSNVLVRAHDATATVMDFGIAKMTTSTKLTATGQTMGTVRYMSPEQVRGQEVDLRTDIYSLGATLYESLTGETPFDGSTHFEIMTKHLSEAPKPPSARGIEVPQLVEDALMKSLSKKTSDRFENAREMRKVLEASLREGDVGLVETQKLNREVLGELRSTQPENPKSRTPPARVATATPTNLADELEPGATGPALKRKAGRTSLWLAIGGLLVAGGAVATVLVLRGDSEPKGWSPKHKNIRGAMPIAGGTFDGVLVETTGILKPEQVATAYKASLAKLRARAKDAGLTFADPIDEIVTIDQNVFCDDSAYPDKIVVDKCASASSATTIMTDGKRRMLVLDDGARLERTLDLGVAEALCLLDGEEKLCAFAEDFRKSYDAPPPPSEVIDPPTKDPPAAPKPAPKPEKKPPKK